MIDFGDTMCKITIRLGRSGITNVVVESVDGIDHKVASILLRGMLSQAIEHFATTKYSPIEIKDNSK